MECPHAVSFIRPRMRNGRPSQILVAGALHGPTQCAGAYFHSDWIRSNVPLTIESSAQPDFSRDPSTWKVYASKAASFGMYPELAEPLALVTIIVLAIGEFAFSRIGRAHV